MSENDNDRDIVKGWDENNFRNNWAITEKSGDEFTQFLTQEWGNLKFN